MSEEKTPPTPQPTVTDQDRMTRLVNMAIELTGEFEELARNSGQQFTSLAHTARRNRMMIWGVIFGCVLDVLLTVVMFIIGSTAVDNTHRLDQLTQDLQIQQTVQRQRALCPLYGIFLDSKSPQGRKAAPDPKKYDHAFEVIQDGYNVLECDKYLKESGRDAW